MSQIQFFSPKFKLNSLVFVHTHSPLSLATIIGIPTYRSPNINTVSSRDGSILEYTEDLLSLAPDKISPESTLLPSCIKGGANATLFLESMPKPRHGTLQFTSDS